MIQRLSFWIMMIVCSVMVSGQEYDGYYTNPILPSGADPWVVKHYCCGVPGGIGVSRSRDLHKIKSSCTCLEGTGKRAMEFDLYLGTRTSFLER